MEETSIEDDAHSGRHSTGHANEKGTELSPFDFFLFSRVKSQLPGRHFQVVREINKEMRKRYQKVTLAYTRNAGSVA